MSQSTPLLQFKFSMSANTASASKAHSSVSSMFALAISLTFQRLAMVRRIVLVEMLRPLTKIAQKC